ncbi:Calcyphosin-like protein [Holothuria leucospilota]|uniref:Calcyphosin-like protein n=1 Tax=Holothuria leucospilota TaxID=206669 RepID=A0A9Q1H6H1_HOLLE|nr:Calcyphosin-like protein [Holothuria leucospilota]
MNDRKVTLNLLLCLVLLQTVISEDNGEDTVSQAHRNILEMVFKEVDKLTDDGIITIDDAINALNVPSSITADGSMTDVEYLTNLLHQFEKEGIIDGQLTLEEYINSQASLSANIPENGLFYRLVRQKWGLN